MNNNFIEKDKPEKNFTVPIDLSYLKRLNDFDEDELIDMISRGNYEEFSHSVRAINKFIGGDNSGQHTVGYITSYDEENFTFDITINSTLLQFMKKKPDFMEGARIEPKVIFDKSVTPYKIKTIAGFFIYPRTTKVSTPKKIDESPETSE